MLIDLDLLSLENRRKMNKLHYYIRNNLLCIKENGYHERADSRTRDASRNYKLKSAKTAIQGAGITYKRHSPRDMPTNEASR